MNEKQIRKLVKEVLEEEFLGEQRVQDLLDASELLISFAEEVSSSGEGSKFFIIRLGVVLRDVLHMAAKLFDVDIRDLIQVLNTTLK